MTASIGILVALGAAPYEARLLTALPSERFHVVRRCVDLPDLLATAAARRSQVAVVSADLRALDAEVVSRLSDEGVAVVGVTSTADTAEEAVLRALGITWVGSADDADTLIEMMSASVVSQLQAGPQEPDSRGLAVAPKVDSRAGTVIAVWGPSGSPGRSVVSLGVGAELAGLGLAALVLDGDVYGGSLAQMLGMFDESSGLLAATRAANSGGLRGESLSRHCRQVDTNLRVLTGLPRADRWVEAKSALVRVVLSAARELADVTVVDCGFSLELDEEISYDTMAPRRNGATIEILERADTILVVGRADPVGLSRLIRGVSDLRSTVPDATPVVVVNRVRGEVGWTRDEIASTLARATGLRQLCWLPDDSAACDRALIQGKTLRESAPGSKLTKGLRQLAVGLAGEQPRPARRRLKGLSLRRG